MNDEFEYRFQVLLKEIDVIQAAIRNYDSTLFKIKGWAITAVSAFIVLAIKEHEQVLLWVGGMAVLLFWALDAIYKSFQRRFIVRYNKIEHFLRTDPFIDAVANRSLKKLNIPDLFGRVSVPDRARKIAPWRAALYPHTSILYLAMMAMLLTIGLWHSFEADREYLESSHQLSENRTLL